MTTATKPVHRRPYKIAGPSSLMAPGHAGTMAIFCGACIYICPNRDPYQSPPRLTAHPLRGSTLESFAQVATWALAAGVENVWILPPGKLAANFHQLASVSRMQAEAGEGYTFHELTMRGVRNSRLAGVVAQRAKDGTQATGYGALCTIWAPAALSQWRLDELPTDGTPEERAEDLAYAWLLASYALGVRLRFSPSYSGLWLLRKHLSGSRIDFAKPSERYAALIEQAHPGPLGWITPAREVPEDAPPVRVWSYDRNWSYVSSARSVPLGDPLQVIDYVHGRPGFYRISAEPPERGWRASMVDPFQRGSLENIWAWEPQMRLALAYDWRITIHEGYAWIGPGSTYDLRPWQERLFVARNDLAHMIDLRGVSAMVARGMVSQIGRAAVGRFKHGTGRALVEEEEDTEATRLELDSAGNLTGLVEVRTALGRDDLYRPEWWYQIIASASERALEVAYRHAPLDGLGGWVDNLYAPSPRGLEGDGSKPGGWHLEIRGVDVPAKVVYGGSALALSQAVKRAARNG